MGTCWRRATRWRRGGTGPDPVRVCFFGDSFTAGVGDAECRGWVGRLGAAAHLCGVELTVYNLGVRRDTSADIARRWQAEAAARLPADTGAALVFSFGANDCASADRGGARVDLDAALDHTAAVLGAARARCSTLMVGPLPILDDPAADARIAALAHRMGQVCAGIGVPFLDVLSIALASDAWRGSASRGDGTHPGADGYAELASCIERWPAWRGLVGLPPA